MTTAYDDPRRWWALAALGLAVLTLGFDITIMNVALPTIATELQVGTVNVREVPGYRLELTPFGGIKDSGLGYKEGVLEAMKSFTNTKT